jgi:hypothetical protein
MDMEILKKRISSYRVHRRSATHFQYENNHID